MILPKQIEVKLGLVEKHTVDAVSQPRRGWGFVIPSIHFLPSVVLKMSKDRLLVSVEGVQCSSRLSPPFFLSVFLGDKDGSKVTTVVATPGQGPDRPQEVSYTDTKVIGNGSFGVVYQAKLCDSGEMVAIKKVLQDKRFKV